MGFLSTWIFWVQSCISTLEFFFLINGQPSPWISTSRGVRQRDPLSPYLFVLVSQNLADMLNNALNLGLIPGLDNRMSLNFNNLIYADDLILITQASRKAAGNCNLCLSINAHLAGQKPNYTNQLFIFLAESIKDSKAISSILNFKIGSFPFTYLGILIARRRISIGQFKPMISRICHTIASWNHSGISLPGRVILINSSVLSYPYIICPVIAFQTLLEPFSKLTRGFF